MKLMHFVSHLSMYSVVTTSIALGACGVWLHECLLPTSLSFRGGLAERLRRLMSREASDISFWEHSCRLGGRGVCDSSQGTYVLDSVLCVCVVGSLRGDSCV